MSIRFTWVVLIALVFGCQKKDKRTDTLVIIHTQLGDITLVLFDDTPKHKESFITMAKEGQYDSTTFHRVIHNFMIQGGDVGAKSGFRNEGKRLIPAEFRANHLHVRGALAAARDGDNVNPEKKSSIQFYIVQGKTFTEKELTTNLAKLNYAAGMYLQSESNLVLRDSLVLMQEQGRIDEMQAILIDLKEEIAEYTALNLDKYATPKQIKLYTTIGGVPYLDGDYTVFGQVLEGMDVVEKIALVKTSVNDKPLNDIFLTMEVNQLPKTEVTSKYGYSYPTGKIIEN